MGYFETYDPADSLGSEIFYSEAIPRETMYLMPRPVSGLMVGPILFQKDPWPAPPRAYEEPYVSERAKALGFLADLLDGLCDDFGMDPEEVWREPKWREVQQIEWDEMRYAADMRMSLSVVNPSAAAVIKGTP